MAKAKKQKEEKKPKSKPVKMSEIQAIQLTYEEAVKRNYVEDNEKNERFYLPSPCFIKLPEILKVTETTPPDTKLWNSRDFVKERRKEILYLKEHRVYRGIKLIRATDGDMIERDFMYDQVCLVPDNKANKLKSLEEAKEKAQEKRIEAKKKKREKDKKKK